MTNISLNRPVKSTLVKSYQKTSHKRENSQDHISNKSGGKSTLSSLVKWAVRSTKLVQDSVYTVISQFIISKR